MYKKIGKYFAAFLLCLISLFVVGCGGVANSGSSSPEEETLTQTIVLSETELLLGVEETKTLQVLFSEEELAIEWSSSNGKIASVKDGAVTGVASGTAIITAKTGGKTLTCSVKVSFDYEAARYAYLPNEPKTDDGVYALRLLVGDSYTIAPALSNGEGEVIEAASFTLTSESEAITLSELTITAVSTAEKVPVKVSCTYENTEYSLTVYVTVVAK